MSETQEPITFEGFDAPKSTRTLAVRIDVDTVYYHTAATSADLIAALQQNDALRREVLNNLDVGLAPEQMRPTFIAQLVGVMRSDPEIRRGVLQAVLPSAGELAGAILVAIDEAQPGDDGNTALVAAKAARKAMGVAE